MKISHGAIPLALVGLLLNLGGCGETAAPGPAPARFADLAAGESTKDTGDYEIHFNAFTTDQLGPEVARQYNIVRSHSRAMLNVTVLKKQPGAMGAPVEADIEANTTNLTGQLKSLRLRKLVEGDNEAIYYIGDLPVANGETLIFDLVVTPANETESHSVRFKRQFYH